MKKQGYTAKALAATLGVHRSTVYRELNRNSTPEGYYPVAAHRKAMKRHHRKAWKIPSNEFLQQIIHQKLAHQQWSPQQMSGWLKKHLKLCLSHECIYQYLKRDKQNGGALYKHLRHRGRYRKRRFGHISRQGRIPGRVSIHQRSKIVEERCRFGDFEIDTLVGKHHKNGIVTVVDRWSRNLWMKKVAALDAKHVTQALRRLLKSIGLPLHTITSDNGKEFALHRRISREFPIQYYFADAYRACQRGSNENTNGLIR